MSTPKDICVSYEMAKMLFNAGWPQRESIFYLRPFIDKEGIHKSNVVFGEPWSPGKYAAPTGMELFLSIQGAWIEDWRPNDRYNAGTAEGAGNYDDMHGKTPQDALAKLWIELQKD